MNKTETRIADLSLKDGESKMVLEGYAIVFDEETMIGDEERGFRETIDRQALSKTMMDDVTLKYNHMDSFLILARTKNDSLKLVVDDKGLKIQAELLDTTTNNDVYKMVKAGLLDKMSFAFTVGKQSWDRSKKVPLRKIESIDRLFDVSIVDLPAYGGTSVYSRSLEMASEEEKETTRKRIHIKSTI